MNILVTGGAGYIGSLTVKKLQDDGHKVIVVDNLLCGHKESVSCPLVVEDLKKKNKLLSIFKKNNFDAVIHFAAYALAGESMQKPYKYFYNNIQGGLNLLECMKKMSVKYLIFSSSCSVYGIPSKLPVSEKSSINPMSVYGESKAMFEKILKWYSKIYGINYTTLRYFNAAGASLDGKLGENHNPETHIIPTIINCLLKEKEFTLYGNQYDTPDGTCIRDYIHIEDLASAHVLALKKIVEENKNSIYNLGSGIGYSNFEIIKMIEKVSKKRLKIRIGKARQGDPSIVYADVQKAKSELGFTPRHSDLKTIITTSYNWMKKTI